MDGPGGPPPTAVAQAAATPSVSSPEVAASPRQTSARKPQPSPVVATMNMQATLKEVYPTITGMFSSPNLDSVAMGTVTNVGYVYREVAQTVVTVEVTDTLRGAVDGQITVWQDGGYVPASEIAAEIKDKYPNSEPVESSLVWLVRCEIRGCRASQNG